METRGYIGLWDAVEERYTLHAAAGKPQTVGRDLAHFVFGLPEDRVRAVVKDVGGGFGAKNPLYPEQALVLWTAKKLGRPVRWQASRSETFLADYQGRGQAADAEMAFDADGKVLAFRVRVLADLGAYLGPRGSTAPNMWRTMGASVYDFPEDRRSNLVGHRHAPGHPVFRCRLFAVGAALAHDKNAKCGMRDLRRHVDVVFVTFKRVEIIRETRPVPRQPFLHNDFRNVLNPLHQTDQHVVMIRADRCETDTAIAHQDRRHTVRRRRQNLVRPGDLRVVMGMHIDKPGNNDPVRGVDLLAPRARYLTHLGNPSVRDRHITRICRRPGSVDNGSAADNQIK